MGLRHPVDFYRQAKTHRMPYHCRSFFGWISLFVCRYVGPLGGGVL